MIYNSEDFGAVYMCVQNKRITTVSVKREPVPVTHGLTLKALWTGAADESGRAVKTLGATTGEAEGTGMPGAWGSTLTWRLGEVGIQMARKAVEQYEVIKGWQQRRWGKTRVVPTVWGQRDWREAGKESPGSLVQRQRTTTISEATGDG